MNYAIKHCQQREAEVIGLKHAVWLALVVVSAVLLFVHFFSR
jgi:hypothetical protein